MIPSLLYPSNDMKTFAVVAILTVMSHTYILLSSAHDRSRVPMDAHSLLGLTATHTTQLLT